MAWTWQPRRPASIDIGGGSVEVTLGSATHLSAARSFKTGVIRLTERYIKSDPLERRDERRLVKHIEREMRGYLTDLAGRGYDRVIGTSGTILSLGTLALTEARGRTVTEIRNQRVSVKALRRLRKQLAEADLHERLRLPGMDPRRADLSVAGGILLDTILKNLKAEELTLCDLALREGLVIDYIQRNSARIRKVDRYPDVRRRSIVELGERCNYWSEHAQQVARLALSIFDQTRSTHGLGDAERELLEYGALLHDVGVHISYERHHRHSYYLIKHGDLRGFEPQEIEVIALIARYHRQALPKKTHEGFDSLSSKMQRVVKKLSAMVRLAEGLDRSHSQSISGIDLYPRGDDYLARLRTTNEAELELWAAHRHVRPLERVLGRPIRFELAGLDLQEQQANAEQTDNPARVSRKTVRGGGHRRVGKNHAARSAGKVA